MKITSKIDNLNIYENKKLRQVSNQFSSIFINMMIKSMRNNTLKSDFIKTTHGQKIYQNMLDNKYSEILSKSVYTKGLSDLIYNQLSKYSQKIDNYNK